MPEEAARARSDVAGGGTLGAQHLCPRVTTGRRRRAAWLGARARHTPSRQEGRSDRRQPAATGQAGPNDGRALSDVSRQEMRGPPPLFAGFLSVIVTDAGRWLCQTDGPNKVAQVLRHWRMTPRVRSGAADDVGPGRRFLIWSAGRFNKPIWTPTERSEAVSLEGMKRRRTEVSMTLYSRME